MANTLQYQLSRLPRSSTVVRVDLEIQNVETNFDEVCQQIEAWLDEKGRPYDLAIAGKENLTEDRNGFKVDFARDENAFALSLEEPDSSIDDRYWTVDVAVVRQPSGIHFGLRNRYRQPSTTQDYPNPRAPRFLRKVADEIGGKDVWPLESKAQLIDVDNLERFQKLAFNEARTLPIIAISEDYRATDEQECPYPRVHTDPDKLAGFLSGCAHVFRITPDAAWKLSSRWGSSYSVYQGAVRCYLRQFSLDDDRYKHRLWLPEFIGRANASRRDGFVDAVVGHVFTQLSSYFESCPLLTPAQVRRAVQERIRQEVATRSVAITVTSSCAEEQVVRVLANQSQNTEHSAQIEEVYQQRIRELLVRFDEQENAIKAIENELAQERTNRANEKKDYEAEIGLWEEECERIKTQNKMFQGNFASDVPEEVRSLWVTFQNFYVQVDQFAVRYKRIEVENDKLQSVHKDLDDAKEKIANLTATNASLLRRNANSAENDNGYISRMRTEWIPSLLKEELTLEQNLELLEQTFPERIHVLDSAHASAKASDGFQYPKEALDLMWRLATDYWECMRDGGDVKAHTCFLDKEYASHEKKNISIAGKKRRTFEYNAQPYYMERHLKIGGADSEEHTFRLHFEWIPDQEKIVIGHCGKHLDF